MIETIVAAIDDLTGHQAFPGIIGAAISLKFVPGKTFWERLVNFLIASATVYWGGPALIEFAGVTSAGMKGCVSFFLGIYGLALISKGFAWVKEASLSDILGSFKSKGKG